MKITIEAWGETPISLEENLNKAIESLSESLKKRGVADTDLLGFSESVDMYSYHVTVDRE